MTSDGHFASSLGNFRTTMSREHVYYENLIEFYPSYRMKTDFPPGQVVSILKKDNNEGMNPFRVQPTSYGYDGRCWVEWMRIEGKRDFERLEDFDTYVMKSSGKGGGLHVNVGGAGGSLGGKLEKNKVSQLKCTGIKQVFLHHEEDQVSPIFYNNVLEITGGQATTNNFALGVIKRKVTAGKVTEIRRSNKEIEGKLVFGGRPTDYTARTPPKEFKLFRRITDFAKATISFGAGAGAANALDIVEEGSGILGVSMYLYHFTRDGDQCRISDPLPHGQMVEVINF